MLELVLTPQVEGGGGQWWPATEDSRGGRGKKYGQSQLGQGGQGLEVQLPVAAKHKAAGTRELPGG
jgi:hypothetical protein